MDLISKYDLIEKIVRTENEEVLQQVKHLLEENETDSWENLDANLRSSIERGLTQSRQKQVTSHRAVMKKLKGRFAK